MDRADQAGRKSSEAGGAQSKPEWHTPKGARVYTGAWDLSKKRVRWGIQFDSNPKALNFIEAPLDSPQAFETVNKIALAPSAEVLRVFRMDISPDDVARGEIWLWSDAPAKVKLALARHDTDGQSRFEGAGKLLQVTSAPQKFSISHTFSRGFNAARLGIVSTSTEPIEVFAAGAKIELARSL